MESEAFKLDRTEFFYKVQRRNKSGKELKSMPTDFFLIINHSFRNVLYVGTGDGDFHLAEENESPMAFKCCVVDSSLFAFRDYESVHCEVHRTLSVAGVDRILWEAISDSVMVEGIRMVNSNLDVYRGCNSKCGAGYTDTLVVQVITEESFVCYENIGEC